VLYATHLRPGQVRKPVVKAESANAVKA